MTEDDAPTSFNVISNDTQDLDHTASNAITVNSNSITVTGPAGETMVLKTPQREADFFLIELHDRLAVGQLVAGVDQRVERERIVVRGGDFLFNQGAENPGLGGGEHDGLRDGHRLLSTLRRGGCFGQSA